MPALVIRRRFAQRGLRLMRELEYVSRSTVHQALVCIYTWSCICTRASLQPAQRARAVFRSRAWASWLPSAREHQSNWADAFALHSQIHLQALGQSDVGFCSSAVIFGHPGARNGPPKNRACACFLCCGAPLSTPEAQSGYSSERWDEMGTSSTRTNIKSVSMWWHKKKKGEKRVKMSAMWNSRKSEHAPQCRGATGHARAQKNVHLRHRRQAAKEHNDLDVHACMGVNMRKRRWVHASFAFAHLAQEKRARPTTGTQIFVNVLLTRMSPDTFLCTREPMYAPQECSWCAECSASDLDRWPALHTTNNENNDRIYVPPPG